MRNLRLGDSARERLARMQKLAAKVPGQLEGALAVARAALDAHEFARRARGAGAVSVGADAARRHADGGDRGEPSAATKAARANGWARAHARAGDPAWTADGLVSERWMPVSPSGRLDGFQWKVPLAEIGVSASGDRGARRRAGHADRGRAAGKPRRQPPPPQAGEIGSQTGGQGQAGRTGDPAGACARRSGPGFCAGRRSGAGTHSPPPRPAWQRFCSCFARRPASGGRIAIPDPRRYECQHSAGVAQR